MTFTHARAHGARPGCLAIVAMIALAASCSHGGPVVILEREQLFSLDYGTAEDKLSLFRLEGYAPPLKTCMTMRDGIFYVSNGDGAKVLGFSSFGDLLSMIYDPDKNPPPMMLKVVDHGEGGIDGISGIQGRIAVRHPLEAVGEIAVDSRKTIYVEDKVPQDRRTWDKDADAQLENVVLRFDRNGVYRDYLGQEGIGGTPFPFVTGIYVTKRDDCVVVCVTKRAWSAFWYDPEGRLEYSVTVDRDKLPVPEISDYAASLEKIIPDPDGKSLFVKVDYYKNRIDEATKTLVSIEYAESWVYRMNPGKATFGEKYEILPYEDPSASSTGSGRKVFEFLGTTSGGYLFFSTVGDDGAMIVAAYNLASRTMKHYSIRIDPDEMNYVSLFLSNDGILCALLATRLEARLVWWRFDKVLPGVGR
ncbi:MAG: hypothetical protein NT080_12170 [Spirochaetes bacterium]|nr:hypothetical protein [Spirochaetota bacterium]